MHRKTLKTISIIMLIAAVIFIIFALNHPEKCFPWNNFITFTIYGAYILIMLVLFIISLKRK